jgi:hypothetical protein
MSYHAWDNKTWIVVIGSNPHIGTKGSLKYFKIVEKG